MDNLDFLKNTTDLIRGLVEVRKIYGSLVVIAHDETYSQKERYEASELTKDGFHSFVGKVQAMDGEEN